MFYSFSMGTTSATMQTFPTEPAATGVERRPRRSGPEAKQDRSRATREALLDALQELLAERPYSEIGISEIVRRADLTTGALYARFGDKHGLAMALQERFARQSADAFAAWAARPEWASATPQAIIANWTRGAVHFCRTYRPLLSLMMSDAAVRHRYDELIELPANDLARLVCAAFERQPTARVQSEDELRKDVEWAARAAVVVLERLDLDDETEARIDTMLRRLIGVE